MKRRILHTIKLDAIAAVDRPCQEGARATIIKRESDMDTISKKAHDEAIAKLEADHKAAVEKLQAEHKAGLDTLTKSVADLKADLDKAKMSDDDREYMESCGDKKKAEFLAMSPADRKKAVALAKSADETLTVAGTTIRKSVVGEAVFVAMKADQDARKESNERLAKAEDDAKMAKLEKRADAEMSHLPGTTAEKAAVLKALESAPEPVRKTAEAIFKAHEEMAANGFKKFGHNGGDPDPTVKKAADDFNGAVVKIQKRDNIGRTAALEKAAKEHPDLLKAYNEAAAVQAANAA